MYQTRVRGEGLFQAVSNGYGQPVATFGSTEKGETPVSLVVIGLASCVTMCVQGYYATRRVQSDPSVEVTTSLDMDQRGFQIGIGLTDLPSEGEQEAILAYIDQKCRVKALLSSELTIAFSFFCRQEEASEE